METKKHKQKKNHVVIVTSNAEDAKVKQFQIRPWLLWLVIITLCLVIGVGFGYILYEDQIWNAANQKIAVHQGTVKEMEQKLQTQQEAADDEAKRYEEEIDRLKEEMELLTSTVGLQKEEVEALKAERDELYNPVLLPLTGAATIEEISEGEPSCIFNASEGALVVATASGTVTEIIEEPEQGYKVTIDHSNGYVTIYRNISTPKVKQGEEVMQGITIFVMDSNSLKLGYQIMKDGIFVNPMEVIEIDG
ncbi:MAG: peptidoglycan DD-metalloendopeptidase family protein [Lachnospiraceae bacterium]|nr:peptidoglycan DD-metalloendopeptidase family protein [Lachnospiraceae bacterium]